MFIEVPSSTAAHISLNDCHQVLVGVHIDGGANPKTYSELLQIQLFQLHVEHRGAAPMRLMNKKYNNNIAYRKSVSKAAVLLTLGTARYTS
ncbi:MAG TPA: hypothetical protein VE244_16550 [Nitrososphaeraceae archaeon]|nr:hypothetical protein [Nitrososphaeraceae archaeon]